MPHGAKNPESNGNLLFRPATERQKGYSHSEAEEGCGDESVGPLQRSQLTVCGRVGIPMTTHCDSCGAPLKTSVSFVCDYCGVLVKTASRTIKQKPPLP